MLGACGNNSETSFGNSEKSSDNSSTVKVNEGLLLNKVTIPATFFEDSSEDEIKAAAEEAGFQSYKINSDGSVTYTMTKARHQEMLNEYAVSINEYIDGLLNGDDETKVEGFSDIESNDDYSEFNIYVSKDTYNVGHDVCFVFLYSGWVLSNV